MTNKRQKQQQHQHLHRNPETTRRHRYKNRYIVHVQLLNLNCSLQIYTYVDCTFAGAQDLRSHMSVFKNKHRLKTQQAETTMEAGRIQRPYTAVFASWRLPRRRSKAVNPEPCCLGWEHPSQRSDVATWQSLCSCFALCCRTRSWLALWLLFPA